MISLQIYDSYALENRLATIMQPCKFSTNEHGFAALMVEFAPATLQAAFNIYEWPETPHVTAADQSGGVVWEGRLEDISIVAGGYRLTAFGYWRALMDVPYTALWSRTGTSDWRPTTADDRSTRSPEQYEMDTNNRLYITPRAGETLSGSYMGGFTTETPHNGEKEFILVEFDYDLTAPSSTWRAQLYRWDRDMTSGTAIWTLDGNGSSQTGSQWVGFGSNPSARLEFLLFYNSGTPAAVSGDTGDIYLKITNLRVASHTTGSSATEVLASSIAAEMATYINGINSDQLSASAVMIEETATDLNDEIFEDLPPAEILDNLALRHGYEVGVWENRRLHFRPRGSASLTWCVDVTAILELERSLEEVKNSAYATYQNANGMILRTGVADDTPSQARFGLVRRDFIQAQTTSETEAESFRDALLTDRADLAIRARIEFDRIYTENGGLMPKHMMRAGDKVIMRNLPPTLSTLIDNIRTFYIGSTEYNTATGQMTLEPLTPIPTLIVLVAKQ